MDEKRADEKRGNEKRGRTGSSDESCFDERVDSLDRFERTIDVQLSLIDAIDRKAANVVRYTTLLVGAIFTALSVVSRSDVLALDEIGAAPRVTFLIGFGSLVVAISIGIVTYLTSRRTYGPHTSYGYAIADGAVRSPQYETLLLRGYAAAIRENQQSISRYIRRLRFGLTALVLGVVYGSLSGGLVALGLGRPAELALTASIVLVTLPVAYRISAGNY